MNGTSRRHFLTLIRQGCLLATPVLLLGCRATPPAGSPMQPAPLGHVVDEANRRQEENAEAAKLIVYTHEFELNKPRRKSPTPWQEEMDLNDKGIVRESLEPHGFRLNEYGVEHVQQIAASLLGTQPGDRTVIIERSETSKHWNTLYHYPVHFNQRLDAERRQVVVDALRALGVEEPERSVVIAPAFPEGLESTEAIQAYVRTRQNSNGGSFGNF